MARFALTALALTSSLLASACSGSQTDTAPTITVRDVYVSDPAGGRDTAGGGLEVSVTGSPVRLVAARSSSATRIELHTHREEDGILRMRRVEAFDIARGDTLKLAPGGPHLMFFGFDDALTPGDEIDVSLVFETETGDEVTLIETAKVRDLAHVGHGS